MTDWMVRLRGDDADLKSLAEMYRSPTFMVLRPEEVPNGEERYWLRSSALPGSAAATEPERWQELANDGEKVAYVLERYGEVWKQPLWPNQIKWFTLYKDLRDYSR